MKKELFIVLLVLFLGGCGLNQTSIQSKDNELKLEKNIDPQTQAKLDYIVDGSRSMLDVCYDHNTSYCEKFFDYAVNMRLMSKAERKLSTEEDPSRPGQKWNLDFSLNALNIRRDVLNRYFENLKMECSENEEILSSIDCSGRCRATKDVDTDQFDFFY